MDDIKEKLLAGAKEAFEELQISQDIINGLEDYLEGSIEEKNYLSRLPKVVMNKMSISALAKTIDSFSAMKEYKYKDYFRKYFNALYKIGREGISQVINFNSTLNEERIKEMSKDGIDKAKLIGIYLNKIVYDGWNFRYCGYIFIHKICKENDDITKQLLNNLNNSADEYYIYENPRKLLNSIYCYHNLNNENELCLKYIKSFEDLNEGTIKKLFKGAVLETEISQIKEIINSEQEYDEQENEELLKKLKSYDYDNYLFRYIVAISCLNRKNSNKLDKIIRLFIDINTWEAVRVILEMMPDEKIDYKIIDKAYGIPTKNYIAYKASEYTNEEFFEFKLKENREAFIEAIELCDEPIQNMMMSYLLDDENKEVFIKKLEDRCKEYMNYIINLYDFEEELKSGINEFLNGNIEFNEIHNKLEASKKQGVYIYPVEDKFEKAMKSLMKLRENKVYNNIIAILFTLNLGEFIGEISNISFYYEKNKKIEGFLKNYKIADEYNIDILNQMMALDSLVTGWSYETTYKKIVEKMIQVLIKNHKEDVIECIPYMSPTGRCLYLSNIYLEENEENAEVVLNNFADTSKLVKEHIVEIFKDSVKYIDKVLLKLNSRKQSERDTAIKVLGKWMRNANTKDKEKDKIVNGLNDLLKREKSQKVRNLLMEVLNIQEDKEHENVVSDEEFIKNLLKGNKKSSLKWIDFENMPKVKFKESEEYCTNEYIQALLLCYSSLGSIGRSIDGERLADKLDKFDLENAVNYIFDMWIENKAESKKKYVLSLASRLGGENIILKLKTNINEWAKKSRGALACDAVFALALNGSNNALLTVDGISRKFKYNSVKSAAGEALDFAAKELEIEREELSDRIVSTLGFDKNGQRIFDYGSRKFTVNLTPALEIEVFNEEEKKLKTLPKPGKKDDEEKSNAAYNEFKIFKKQLKNTIEIQSSRMDEALSSNRKWSIDSWKNLFVENPIMNCFAIGLIWGVYENDILKDTFRYMDDGTFNTKDEDEFTLLEEENSKDKYKIGLVHPIELSEEELSLWKQQLLDYEIVQPIEQLERTVFTVSEDEEDLKESEIFGGKIINGLSLSGKLLKFGWNRGDVYDGGWYCEFYKYNEKLKLCAELNFEGLPVGFENENTTIYTVKFYKADSENQISNLYGKNKDKYLLKLKMVPKKFYSEIIYNIEQSLVSSSEVNEKWRSNL